MKNTLVFLITFLWAAALTSQTPDTTFISINQENTPLEKQRLMDSYDQVFGTLEPTRWLFALNFLALSDNQDDLLRASMEVKILPAISLHGSYGFGFGYSSPSVYGSAVTVIAHRYAVQPRWYYAMPRRIRQGKSANNMSGNYIGLEGVFVRTNSNIGKLPVFGEQRSLALRYGLQRRLFRYGFLDIGFGVGVTKEQRNAWQTPFNNELHLFANSEIGLGLALARPKTATTSGGYCDVLRCFREERQMWKIDLYNLVRINDFDNYRTQLSIGYERKIGASPLSLEVQGEGSQRHRYSVSSTASESAENTYAYGGSLQSRYYYSQSKNIAKGKSGNNLSGVYLGVQCRWLEEYSREQGYERGDAGLFPFKNRLTSQSLSGSLLWGIQHRLFEHGFIDFQVMGSQSRLQNRFVNTLNGFASTNSSLEFNLALKLRAGLAF